MSAKMYRMPMSEEEAGRLMSMAIGRLLRMGSRPAEPGDAEMFERCAAAIREAAEVLGISHTPRPDNFRPGWNFGNMVVD